MASSSIYAESLIGALYIHCYGGYSCNSQAVNAQTLNGGIEVICQGSSACTHQTITAPQMQGDYSFAEITCSGSSACNGQVVNVDQTKSVRLWCRDGVNACASNFNASHAESVEISCYGDSSYSCTNGIFYVDHAESSIFNASGSYAMSDTQIYAQNMPGDLMVYCDEQYSCQSMTISLGTMTGSFNMKCGATVACDEVTVYGADSNGEYVQYINLWFICNFTFCSA